MHYGISAAITGNVDSSRFQTTIIKSDSRDQAKVVKSWDEPLRLHSKHDVKRVTMRFLETIAEVAKLQKSEGTSEDFALVLGCPSTYPKNSFKEAVAQISDLKLFGKLDSTKTSYHFFKILIDRYLKSKSFKMPYFSWRQFDIHKTDQSLTDKELYTKWFKENNISQYEERLRELKARADMKDVDALKELRTMAENKAEQQALKTLKFCADQGQQHNVDTIRFQHLGPLYLRKVPEDSEGALCQNFVRWFDLRNIFIEKFKQILGIRHNICIKAPADPEARPFQDVAFAFTQDLHDGIKVDYDEIHREEY